MLGRFIDLRIFLISLAIGLFLVYIYQPSSTVIHVYPTPDNIDQIQFKDKADNCYEFEKEEVSCLLNKDKITNIPLQN